MSKKPKQIEELEIIYDKVISGKYSKEKFVVIMDALLFKKWHNGYEQALIDNDNNFTDDQKEQTRKYKKEY